MNKKELLLFRTAEAKKYKVPNCAPYTKRARNAVYISAANTFAHEAGKLKVCHDLKKAKQEFVTEVMEKSTGLIRDVVCLDTGVIYEVETSSRRAARFKGEPNTVVIALWEGEKE